MYATKVWGFGVPAGPLIFGTAGWRDNARRVLKPGDEVVLIGTSGTPTNEDDQGKILAIIAPTTEAVQSLDFPISISEHDYDKEGNYRWPFGLLISDAWILPDRPIWKTISGRNLGQVAAAGIVALTQDEQQLVEAYRREAIPLLSASAHTERRLAEALGRPRFGPAPSTTRQGIMHMRRANASTYFFELLAGKTSVGFKIGWAFDFKQRLKTFNQYALPSLGGLRYRGVLEEPWDTARQAYGMEQALLRRFAEYRSRDNGEVLVGISEKEIRDVWYTLVTRGRQRRPFGD